MNTTKPSQPRLEQPVFSSVQKYLLAVVCAFAFLATEQARANHVWINEFHYDNTGADTGEFIEIAVRSDDFFNAAAITLTLYDGATGAVYGTPMTLSAFTASSPFSIANSSTTVRFLTLAFASGGLINGQGGFSLSVNQGPAAGLVIQFLSYGGSFTAIDGPASGRVSTDVGVTENDTTPVGASLGLSGTGFGASDFTWANNAGQTAGAPNMGQSFAAVPEPSTYAMLAAGALLLVSVQRLRAGKKSGH